MLKLTQADKCQFSDEFLARFLDGGFGTLPKREIEILVFHLISRTRELAAKSNYDIANRLKITESRVKSFRLEAHLRYGQLAHREALKQIVALFFKDRSNKLSLDGDTISFGLEDPVLKREFEHAVKKVGHVSDTSFNREMVKVRTHVFLAVLFTNFDNLYDDFVEAVREEQGATRDHQEIVSETLPISERMERFLGKHREKTALLERLARVVSAGMAAL